MGFKCGIVGLPNVGKSTLFNALSNAGAEAANYPFCTIEPNVGMVPVPDERLDKLTEIVQPQKVLPAIVQIVDIAGLVKGASKGEGLGNQFLANIRECDAVLHVLRCFEDENIVHVEGVINPMSDKDVIDLELQLKDLETIEKRLDKARKAAKTGEKEPKREADLLERLFNFVQQGKSARAFETNQEDERELVDGLFLLTRKPVLYVCNVDEDTLASGEENDFVKKVRAGVADEKAEVLVICAALEAQIAQFEELQERLDFLEAMNIVEPGLNKLIRSAYRLLGLHTYFTAGVKEVRAWTIEAGMKAPQAAGVIHSDFERGFIRAEVIKYDDYVLYKTESAVRDAGKMGVMGKEYVVQDGDIMHFRFNV